MYKCLAFFNSGLAVEAVDDLFEMWKSTIDLKGKSLVFILSPVLASLKGLCRRENRI
jgi:hypothetical protein